MNKNINKIDNFSKLTDASKELVITLVEDFRNQLIDSAGKHALDITGEISEISVRDVLKAYDDILKQKPNSRKKLYGRVSIMYVFFGVFIVGANAVGFNWSLAFPNISQEIISNSIIEVLGLLSLLFGIFLYFSSPNLFSGSFLNNISTEGKRDLSIEIVRIWRDIEIEAREAVGSQIGNSEIESITIGGLVNYLIKFNILENRDRLRVEQLLNVRNKIVHKQEFISKSTFRRFRMNAEIIMSKLIRSRRGR